MARRRKSLKPVASINVVPYIDVMLVLLIIFMITAPIVNQGVQVDLPQAASEPLSPDMEEPVIIAVDRNGDLFISVGDNKKSPVADDELVRRIQTVMLSNPKINFLVQADKSVAYEQVIRAMTLIQQGGAPSVGLSTEPLN